MKFKTKMLVFRELKNYEKSSSCKVNNEEAKRIIDYCEKKVKRIGKTEKYLPLLFKYELPLQLQMNSINDFYSRIEAGKERSENVFGVRNDTMSSYVS